MDKDYEIKRYALWKAYNMKCAYSGNIIDNFDDLHIDHIIPKNEFNNKTIIEEKKKEHQLGSSFSINDLENLIPTKKNINILKGSDSFPIEAEHFFIQIAKKKKTKVELEVLKFKKLIKDEEYRQVLRVSNSYTIEEYDVHYKDFFKPKREVLDYGDEYDIAYVHSIKYVMINGRLPSLKDEVTGAVLSINGLETMPTFNFDEILKLLTEIENRSLRDILYRGSSYEGTKSFIVYESLAVHLLNEVFEELLIILKDYLNEFKIKFKEFEHKIGIESYRRVENHYEIMTLNRLDWILLNNYFKKFNVGDGTGKKYIYLNWSGGVMMYDENVDIKLFTIKPSHFIDDEFNSTDTKVSLLWEIPSSIKERHLFTKGKMFKANDTRKWIESKLKKLKRLKKVGLI